jgi:hypothetical protein
MTGKEILWKWMETHNVDALKLGDPSLGDAIDAAIAQEREACAETVHEVLNFQSCMCCQRAMKAIRARSTP